MSDMARLLLDSVGDMARLLWDSVGDMTRLLSDSVGDMTRLLSDSVGDMARLLWDSVFLNVDIWPSSVNMSHRCQIQTDKQTLTESVCSGYELLAQEM